MFFTLLFGLSEVILDIFALSILANRPLSTTNREHTLTQKHLSDKLEIKPKQLLNINSQITTHNYQLCTISRLPLRVTG